MPLATLQTLLGSTGSQFTRFGEAVNEVARLSPMVIALRTEAAFSAFTDPSSAASGETFRMVAEKIDALTQGMVAATLETGLAISRGMTEGHMPLDAGFGIATAAMAPMRDRLRDNVRRLGPDADALPLAAE